MQLALPKIEGLKRFKWKDYDFLLGVAGTSVMLVFGAYIVASLATSVILVLFSGGSGKASIGAGSVNYAHPQIVKITNYRDLRKDVLARNIFNSEGVLPDEPDPSEVAANTFDPKANCQKPTVNVELLGIIATGSPDTSLATIQEKGYTIADVYRAGETIIGNDQALIFAVEEDKVVLNNNGVKECLELNTVKPKNTSASGVAAMPSPSPTPSSPAEGEAGGAECPSGTVSLEVSYVEESLGPGFSKILEAGRLVPFHRDNAMVGFKLIGVRGGSLWSRSNLGSGDVITAVNGASMAQPERGFALYESLQADRQIRVEFLKAGKTPCITNIEIK